MEQRTNEELEINLGELFFALLRKWWIIGQAGLLCAIIAFAYAAFFIEPTFESTTAVYIISRQNEDTTTYSDVQLGNQIVSDFVELAERRTVYEQVIDELGLDLTVKQLNQLVSVVNETGTRVVSITATHTDPEMAQKIADKVRDVAAEYLVNVMDLKAVNTAEEANLPTTKAAPSIAKYTLIGGFLGVFVAAGIIAVIFIIDDTIKNPSDVEKYLGLSNLGSIPYSDTDDAKKSNKSDKGKKKDK